MRKQNTTEASLFGRSGLYALLLVVVGAVTYASSFNNPFIFDDGSSVELNPYIRHAWPPSQWFLAQPDAPTEGRPVVSLSLALNYAWGQEDPRGYHAVNIALHILCALVLYGVVRRTLLLEKLRPRFGHVADGFALAVAMIWMVHPLVTECVNYVTQRTESIMAIFYLLTLYCAIRAIDAQKRSWWYVGAIASCMLGMASKEVMVTAPLVVVLYDWTFLNAAPAEIVRRRRPLYLGLAASWIVLGLLMVNFPHASTVGAVGEITSWEYLKNQSVVIVDYLKLALWPHPLLIDYGLVEPVPFLHVAPYAVLVVALLAATAVAIAYRSVFGFLGAWFFLILAPTSSFVPLPTEVAAERRMYLPLAAIVVLAVVAGYLFLDPRTARNRRKTAASERDRKVGWLRPAVVLLMAALLAWGTLRRNADYENEVAIWQSVVMARPEKYRGHINLGAAYEKRAKQSKDVRDIELAEACYRRAVELNPDSSKAYNNLGMTLVHQRKLHEAVACWNRALMLDPNNADAHNNLAIVLAGRHELDQAMQHYQKAVRLRPDDARLRFNLSTGFSALGKLSEAEAELREALRLNPNYAAAHRNLGDLLANREELDEAGVCYRRAIQLVPQDASSYLKLGYVLELQGNLTGAAAQYRQALAVKPDYGIARDRLQSVQARMDNQP